MVDQVKPPAPSQADIECLLSNRGYVYVDEDKISTHLICSICW